MGNLFDYLEWRGDLTFAQSEFNKVDNLVLSVLSYVELTGIAPEEGCNEKITIKEAADYYFEFHDLKEDAPGLLLSNDFIKLFYIMARSKRFGSLQISHYVNHVDEAEEKQFSALTVYLGDRTAFIAFRGTDDTIVGWKEDFNMSFQTPVPSQTEAVSYLKMIMKQTRCKLRLGGHSKGGNLAVFATAFSGIRAQRRVIEIYNNDGPGFTRKIIETDEYKNIMEKIHTYVPQSSVIGMLLEHEESYQVVHSNQKGIFQHDPFSWEITGTEFVYEKNLTHESRVVDQTLKEWILSMDDAQKSEFVDALFGIFEDEEYTTLSELSIKSLGAMIKSYNNMAEETRHMLQKTIKLLIEQAKKNAKIEWKIARSQTLHHLEHSGRKK